MSRRLALFVFGVAIAGVAAGALGAVAGNADDYFGLLALVLLVGAGQAFALEIDNGSISVAAVGSLTGAALFGPRAALALAVTSAAVEWSARRSPLHRVLFNVGALSLASLTAVAAFDFIALVPAPKLALAVAGISAGALYFVVNTGLVSLALALEGRERWLQVFRERFLWLLPHYVTYGFIGGLIAAAYDAMGLLALVAFVVPLLAMRHTQEAYVAHTQQSSHKLRQAANTIQAQNASLEEANKLLRERSTAAMEGLSATVDARDAYTAGHSRRVRTLATAIGQELDLSQADLDVLAHAALFHDIGKLAIPDAILLKPASLSADEWAVMRQHADEGAKIIGRLGFLDSAVAAIRHHHEHFDGRGYPEGLAGESIPLSARIIHVADAFDSMLTARVYRAARPVERVIAEVRACVGTQFCPRCVFALERVVARSSPQELGLEAAYVRPVLIA